MDSVMQMLPDPRQWDRKRWAQSFCCLLWFILWCCMLGAQGKFQKKFKQDGPLFLLNAKHKTDGEPLPTVTICPQRSPMVANEWLPLTPQMIDCEYYTKKNPTGHKATGHPATVMFEGIILSDYDVPCVQYLAGDHIKVQAIYDHMGLICSVDKLYHETDPQGQLYIAATHEPRWPGESDDMKFHFMPDSFESLKSNSVMELSLVRNDERTGIDGKITRSWYEITQLHLGMRQNVTSTDYGKTTVAIGFGNTAAMQWHEFTTSSWNNFQNFFSGTLGTFVISYCVWAVLKYSNGWQYEDNTLFPPLKDQSTEATTAYGSAGI